MTEEELKEKTPEEVIRFAVETIWLAANLTKDLISKSDTMSDICLACLKEGSKTFLMGAAFILDSVSKLKSEREESNSSESPNS